MEEKVLNRLTTFAHEVGVPKTEVISIKFRPVKPGAQYTDPFGRKDANAYVYNSEYEAGRQGIPLQQPDKPLARALADTISHPSPWTHDYEKFIRQFTGLRHPGLWIQHETGLEILSTVADVLGVVGFGFTIWELMRRKIDENRIAKESDRYWKEVTKVRIEIRYVTSEGRVGQRLIYEEDISVIIDQKKINDADWMP